MVQSVTREDPGLKWSALYLNVGTSDFWGAATFCNCTLQTLSHFGGNLWNYDRAVPRWNIDRKRNSAMDDHTNIVIADRICLVAFAFGSALVGFPVGLPRSMESNNAVLSL